MNTSDTIIYLAQNASKTFFPLQEDDTEDISIPYFSVKKNSYDRYDIEMFNYEKHDNAPRMPYYCDFLLNKVFPNIPHEVDISGIYPIELHDSYTYLNNGKNYDNVLVFSKDKNDKYPTLLPDPFMVGNYGNRLTIEDPILRKDKNNKIGFYGVTTGNRNASKNERLKLCEWSVANRDFSECYITGIAQMEREDILKAYPDKINQMIHQPVDQYQQYSYKYLLSIDGNTASWDRLCWIMNSQSVLMKYYSNEILWYYPLINDGVHYKGVNIDNMKDTFMFLESNPGLVEFINLNANLFIKNYITPLNTILYTTYLFENIAENKA